MVRILFPNRTLSRDGKRGENTTHGRLVEQNERAHHRMRNNQREPSRVRRESHHTLASELQGLFQVTRAQQHTASDLLGRSRRRHSRVDRVRVRRPTLLEHEDRIEFHDLRREHAQNHRLHRSNDSHLQQERVGSNGH